jgi:hypothetical protein
VEIWTRDCRKALSGVFGILREHGVLDEWSESDKVMQRFLGDRGWLIHLPHIFEHRYLQEPTINIPTLRKGWDVEVGDADWPIGVRWFRFVGLWLEVGAASRIVIGDVASSRV